jgi:hypothetical protein
VTIVECAVAWSIPERRYSVSDWWLRRHAELRFANHAVPTIRRPRPLTVTYVPQRLEPTRTGSDAAGLAPLPPQPAAQPAANGPRRGAATLR